MCVCAYVCAIGLIVYVVAGDAYEEPRLTCWFGELPYTYARSTMASNTQVEPAHTATHTFLEVCAISIGFFLSLTAPHPSLSGTLCC